MKVLTPGQFIEKVPDSHGGLITINDGTTNEELLKGLINRCELLHGKFPSDETWSAIENLGALQSRPFDRMQRGVEGKPAL